jgi:hypothetical protein
MHDRELARPHAVFALRLKAQLLAPQRAQLRLMLRVRRRSLLNGRGRGAGEERVQAWLPRRSARSVTSVASAAAHARPRPGPLAGQEARGAAEHLTDGFELIG